MSDVHVEFEDFDPPPAAADAVVLAGDIHVRDRGLDWALEKFPDSPVLYILGNHEYYGEAMPAHLEKMKQRAAGTNVSVLENESLSIGDVTFLCCTLWTDFTLYGDALRDSAIADQVMSDYRLIRVSPAYRQLCSSDTAALHRRSKSWLAEAVAQPAVGKRVVITHHAPSLGSVPEGFRGNPVSAAYATNLDDLVEHGAAELWIHGHLHSQSDYRIGGTRIVCNPRGYPDERNPRFVPDLVIEV
jgi:predicted phosphohydrolase